MQKLYDPYKKYRPYFLRWDGSIILHAFPSVFIATIISGIVCLLYERCNINLSISATLTPVLSIVVGLLLTYRTNTSYDRQGRRLWSKMIFAIRGLVRHICINIDSKSNVGSLEQKAAINLLIGFAFSTKHYLREEGTECDDLKPFISSISIDTPNFVPLTKQVAKVIEKEKKKQNLGSKAFKWVKRKFKSKKQKPKNYNLPLAISLYLTSYVDKQFKNNIIDQPTANLLYINLNTLIDCLSGFERILNTPIPLAYAIHLSHTVWIYCVSLPFQLVSTMHYATIPVVLIVSFILFGIEEIGEEIEDPFGYDDNDLNLDHICNVIKEEIQVTTIKKRVENQLFDNDRIIPSEAILQPSGSSTFDRTLYEIETRIR
ncbi:28390_t:CDS:2 [Dentiscutata erythropus]|uniref:28390_t:CDS:1 n=1 Tax=Dentiscutata erythropus TaxID=1348616 RepID=A0A9N8VSL7_9GLOM|nr:28390_t:CDS:2 [Dentiscutata erythropus]